MAESRRVRLTKRLIRDAFVELLEEHPISKVTVTDICNKADVNRSTFYSYYDDVYMLLHEIEEDIIAQIPEADELPLVDNLPQFLDKIEAVFDYVKENGRMFKVVLGQVNDDALIKRIIKIVLEKYPKNFFEKDTVEVRYCYIFCVHGFIGMLKDWVNNGFPIESRAFAELALNMVIRATRFPK